VSFSEIAETPCVLDQTCISADLVLGGPLGDFLVLERSLTVQAIPKLQNCQKLPNIKKVMVF